MNGKLIAACVVAVAGIAVVAWQVNANFGGRTVRTADSARSPTGALPDGAIEDVEDTGEGPRRVVSGGDAPPPRWMEKPPEEGIESFSFDRVKSTAAAGEAIDNADSVLLARFEVGEGTSSISESGRMSAIDAWRTFMRPMVVGELETFKSAVAMFGGVTTPNDEGRVPAEGLYDRLHPLYEAAPIAFEQAKIRAADPNDRQDVPTAMLPPDMEVPPGAVLMMMAVNESRDDATGETTRREALGIPLQLTFPQAAEAAAKGEKVIEIWAPTKVKGATGAHPDLGTSVFLAWNRAAQAWQPVAMRVVFLSDKGREKMDMGGG